VLLHLIQSKSISLSDQQGLDQITSITRHSLLRRQFELERQDGRRVVFGVLGWLEGQNSEEHLDKENTQAPNISPIVIALTFHHFVRVVARGACAALVAAVSLHLHCQTEIRQHDL